MTPKRITHIHTSDTQIEAHHRTFIRPRLLFLQRLISNIVDRVHWPFGGDNPNNPNRLLYPIVRHSTHRPAKIAKAMRMAQPELSTMLLMMPDEFSYRAFSKVVMIIEEGIKLNKSRDYSYRMCDELETAYREMDVHNILAEIEVDTVTAAYRANTNGYY